MKQAPPPETLFPPLGDGIRPLLEGLPALIDRVFPLPRRFRAGLPRDVAELSRLLTSGRAEREGGYLGRPGLLSAYLRYFLPWNVYRLCRLIPALPLPLAAGDALTDLGSGPLTLPLALWVSRPDLRGLSLEFRCLDRTGAALEAGKALFSALAGKDTPWVIKTLRAPLGAPVHGPRAALVTAVNIYNEVPGPGAKAGALVLADKEARLLSALTGEGGSILVVEPGIPRSGEFIAALRDALAEQGRFPLAPCPHGGVCPFPGGLLPGSRAKAKWCHFAFTTGDAPRDLHRLSAAAGLPKERAVLSFLLAGPRSGNPPAPPESPLPVRIISDAFPLSRAGEYGRYGCSAKGLILAAGTREKTEPWEPGTLLRIAPPPGEQRDPKSKALIFPLSTS
jgi:hypothetical protein